jgi:hypothetical protein
MVAAMLCKVVRSDDSASPIALLRARLFFSASANNRAKDFALGTVAVCLQELDITVDEDALALLESVCSSISKLIPNVRS